MTRSAPAALLIAGSLAACAGAGVSVVSFVNEPSYGDLPSPFRAAATAPVEVYGSPPDGSSPEAVAAAVRLPASEGGATGVLAGSGGGGHRIVLSFSPASPGALCAGTGPGGGSSPLQVTGVWCDGTRAVSSGQLRNGAVAGPSDPGFTRALMPLLSTMFRSRPRAGGGGPDGGGGL